MKIVEMLFGTSWKTSLIGYLGLAAGAIATAMSTRTEPGYLIAGLAFAALARMAKDADKTGT
jgi:hypothetical protein